MASVNALLDYLPWPDDGIWPDSINLIRRDGKRLVYSARHIGQKAVHTKDGIVGHCTCTECGEVVRRRDKFCWNCGSELGDV